MMPRSQSARFLRIAASTLAVLGLLGHGLAMLLAALVGASAAAAQEASAGIVQICSAERAVAAAMDGVSAERRSSESEAPPAPPAHGKTGSCSICSAYAHSSVATLPFVPAMTGGAARSRSVLPADAATALPSLDLYAFSRGPPLA